MAKQFFKNLPDTSTPITADRLNGLLDGEEAMGNLVVDSIRTKNMLDINNIENGYSYSYGTSGSVPTPTANNNRASISVINAIKVKPNTTYTFNSTSTTFRFAIGQMTNEKISLGDTGWVTSFPYTITTSSTCNYLGFNFSKKDNSTITTNDFNDFINSNLILEEGNTATEYFPYQELNAQNIGNYWQDKSSSITIKDNKVQSQRTRLFINRAMRLVFLQVYYAGTLNVGTTTDIIEFPLEYKPAFLNSDDLWIPMQYSNGGNSPTTRGQLKFDSSKCFIDLLCINVAAGSAYGNIVYPY